MVQLKNFGALGIVLLLFWMVLVNGAEARLLITGIIAVVSTLMLYRWILHYFNLYSIGVMNFFCVVRFFINVMVDIIFATLAQMRRIIQGSATPCLFEVHLSIREPFLIALIANAITLTPGSMTVEVDGFRLLVLAFVKDDLEIDRFREMVNYRYERVLKGGKVGA